MIESSKKAAADAAHSLSAVQEENKKLQDMSVRQEQTIKKMQQEEESLKSNTEKLQRELRDLRAQVRFLRIHGSYQRS